MIRDCFGGRHANICSGLAAYEEAVRAFLRHRPVAPSLAQALACEPFLIRALLLKGFCNVLLARQETMATARFLASEASMLLQQSGGSASEVALCKALNHSALGDFDEAVAILRAFANIEPHDILVLKLIHCLQFLGGRSADMPAFTGSMLPHWNENMAGYGHLLGCHSFGLAETGCFREAETLAQSALHFDREDLWAMHALAHVYEMNGRDREGIIWIESARHLWRDAASFGFHLAWHLALFNLNLGRHDRALEIYDADVRSERSEAFRDVANAVSLLWRLQQEGVRIGDRFEELAQIARSRADDMSLIFASLHDLLALLAIRDHGGAAALVTALRERSLADGSQAAVAREIGLPLALVLTGLAQTAPNAGDLGVLLQGLPRLGGSHAQRDVFLRLLAMLTAEQGDRSALDAIWAQRHILRREDRFLRLVETRARIVQPQTANRYRQIA